MMEKTNELLDKLNHNIERGNRTLVVVTIVNIITVIMLAVLII